MSESGAALSAQLLSILVDPVDHGPLWYFAQRSLLYNPRTRCTYAIRNQIPVLLESEALALGESEASELDRSLGEAVETGGR